MDMNVKLNTVYAHSGNSAKADASLSDRPASKDVTSSKADQVKPDTNDIKQAVKDIQDFVDSVQRNLEFSIDDSTGTVVVKVIAKESGELIRQLPSEEALKLAQNLRDDSSGLLQEKV
ncbi:flagellar protein FlaG [Pseudomonas asuensis]|uniref:Flagellar protein FlaG n=1 Tax=Pseudomonas asuensis TaxID=1825787 RepID=A0ABQ2GN63_9PSED|nr:flagellar protein FlaG [Pseudomonas asuensis]GGM03321.1 flagellar protein FlaG [Pseudomonas asuensis]